MRARVGRWKRTSSRAASIRSRAGIAISCRTSSPSSRAAARTSPVPPIPASRTGAGLSAAGSPAAALSAARSGLAGGGAHALAECRGAGIAGPLLGRDLGHRPPGEGGLALPFYGLADRGDDAGRELSGLASLLEPEEEGHRLAPDLTVEEDRQEVGGQLVKGRLLGTLPQIERGEVEKAQRRIDAEVPFDEACRGGPQRLLGQTAFTRGEVDPRLGAAQAQAIGIVSHLARELDGGGQARLGVGRREGDG